MKLKETRHSDFVVLSNNLVVRNSHFEINK